MTAPVHPKFGFDTVFDNTGQVAYAPPRQRKAIPLEEVEAIRAAAFAEGENSAVAKAKAEMAAALDRLAQTTRMALATLTTVAHEHRAGSAALALACAGKIADAALARFPEAPVAAALEALAREVEQQPRLLLRVAPHLLDEVQAAVEQTAAAIGYPGQIVAKADPALPPAAFVLDWGDGRAAFDPQAAAQKVEEALRAALAAEGGHAESLTPPQED